MEYPFDWLLFWGKNEEVIRNGQAQNIREARFAGEGARRATRYIKKC